MVDQIFHASPPLLSPPLIFLLVIFGNTESHISKCIILLSTEALLYWYNSVQCNVLKYYQYNTSVLLFSFRVYLMVFPQSVDLSRIRPQDVAVVIAFLAAVFIFRAPDVYELKPVWRLDIEKTTESEHTNIL